MLSKETQSDLHQLSKVGHCEQDDRLQAFLRRGCFSSCRVFWDNSPLYDKLFLCAPSNIREYQDTSKQQGEHACENSDLLASA